MKKIIKNLSLFASLTAVAASVYFVACSNNVSDVVAPDNKTIAATSTFETDPYTDKTVVRVYDPGVSSFVFGSTSTDYYWRTFSASKLQSMLETGIKELTAQSSVSEAWKKILPGVTSSSKIAVKVNHNNIQFFPNDWYRSNMNDPPMIIALTKSLEAAGLQQANITFFDPSRTFPTTMINDVRAQCPNVSMKGKDNMSWSSSTIYISCGNYNFNVPQTLIDANYLIDMCLFKAHVQGITGAMKNLGGLGSDPGRILHPSGCGCEYNNTLWELISNTHVKNKLKLCISEAIFGSQQATEYISSSKLNKTDFFPNNKASSVFVARSPFFFDNVLYDFMNVEKNGSPTSVYNYNQWLHNCVGKYPNWTTAAINAGSIVTGGTNMPPKDLRYDPNVIEFISVPNGTTTPPPPPPTNNLAYNKTASASSYQTGNGVANGNDGNTGTRWCANGSTLPQWWKVDLGAAYSLTQTKVTWEKNTAYKYKIEVSSDNAAWTTVADKSANTTASSTNTDNFTATSARYIRVTVSGIADGSWASFYEFEAYGSTTPPPPPPSGTNLALNKTASASSEQTGNGVANGNDGNTATRWCANGSTKPQWWKVDLGAANSVAQTKITWQKNTAYQYKVEVSTDNATWKTVVDKSANTTASSTNTDSFTATSARYIRVTVSGIADGSWVSFYEFAAYAGS